MGRITWLLIFGILAGCIGNQAERKKASGPSSILARKIAYAKGFSIEEQDTGLLVTVKDPWQHATGIQYQYILSNTFSGSGIVDEFTSRIKIPVKRVVCLSTTHVGFIAYLGETESITGISGKDYIENKDLRKRIGEGSVIDVGYDENLNYESLLRIKPDVVFAYGVGAGITSTIRKLHELGIPVVMIGEYLEEEPLAKMEWVKVFAAFYGLGETTAARFDSVAGQYKALADLAGRSVDKPGVLLGLPWQGTWYVSGSQSYVAQLVADAGGRYIWDHLDFRESKPMALEAVFEHALSADFWLNPGDVKSMKDIIGVDERFGRLPAYSNDRVFNNNNIMSPSGGNAFFESGVTEPEIILSDLIYILHPQLLPSHKLKYYRKLR